MIDSWMIAHIDISGKKFRNRVEIKTSAESKRGTSRYQIVPQSPSPAPDTSLPSPPPSVARCKQTIQSVSKKFIHDATRNETSVFKSPSISTPIDQLHTLDLQRIPYPVIEHPQTMHISGVRFAFSGKPFPPSPYSPKRSLWMGGPLILCSGFPAVVCTSLRYGNWKMEEVEKSK